LTLIIAELFSCGQSSKSTSDKLTSDLGTVDTITVERHQETSPIKIDERQFIDTEFKYTDSNGKGVIIQNSFPKGAGYTDPTGKNFEGRIFWTRVINETATPLELTINFPADSFAILASPDSYLKVFLPSDSMTIDKETLYSYGITGLKSFLDTGLNKPTMVKRTIAPKEAYLFYTGILMGSGGVTRAGFALKGQDLFYRINLLGSTLIPCGQIVSKK
jgi:hypothetical protein